MMHQLNYLIRTITWELILVSSLIACGGGKPTSTNPGRISTATGIPFNRAGGFQVKSFKGQAVGPGLTYVEGGSTIMGAFSEGDIINNNKREVSVASFFIGTTPVTNLEWAEYLDALKREVASMENQPTDTPDSLDSPGKQIQDARAAYAAALPNEEVWKHPLAYNDPYIENYLRHPGFRLYPVVGVSWTQANQYCKWRTKVVNEYLALKAGISYDLESKNSFPIESGVFIAEYRLPTEAEWEYAARGMVGTQSLNFVQSAQRVYPWDGLSLRGQEEAWEGKYLANFKFGRGNYKGIAGENDGNGATSEVYDYPPNDLGLYDMVGNVNEWVYDLYRPNSLQDIDDFNPVRRDDTLDLEAEYDQSNSLVNNRARVYKGGSWQDCAHWLQIGTRRYLHEDSSSATIGFRCAMTSVSRANAK